MVDYIQHQIVITATGKEKQYLNFKIEEFFFEVFQYHNFGIALLALCLDCVDYKTLTGSGRLHKIRNECSVLDVVRGLSLRYVLEELEVAVEVLVDRQHGRDITAAIAVVGGAPHGDQVLVREVILVPFHH